MPVTEPWLWGITVSSSVCNCISEMFHYTKYKAHFHSSHTTCLPNTLKSVCCQGVSAVFMTFCLLCTQRGPHLQISIVSKLLSNQSLFANFPTNSIFFPHLWLRDFP